MHRSRQMQGARHFQALRHKYSQIQAVQAIAKSAIFKGCFPERAGEQQRDRGRGQIGSGQRLRKH